jgi:hypothetical protein
MKKTILIILGILIITLVVSVWVYLLMFGKPESASDVFARFGAGETNTSQTTVDTNTYATTTNFESVVDTTPRKLKQLTTRPVAGAYIAENVVRYVEQGTGHVYEIDLGSGAESLISGTTIPQTTSASFGSDGETLTVSSLSDGTAETIVGTIDRNKGQIDGVALPKGATEIAFADTESVYYLLEQPSGASGYIYDITDEASTELFAIPLRDVRVLWGNPHYVYTTPTASQMGYIYKISGKSTLSFVTPGGYGLTAERFGYGVVTTSIYKDTHSYLAHGSDGTKVEQALPYIPEKCVVNPSDETYLFCTVPRNLDGLFPDDWYMGARSYNDALWGMHTGTGEAVLMLDFLSESGREMDVYKIEVDETGMRLLFVNKNDNTLWMFDRGVE